MVNFTVMRMPPCFYYMVGIEQHHRDIIFMYWAVLAIPNLLAESHLDLSSVTCSKKIGNTYNKALRYCDYRPSLKKSQQLSIWDCLVHNFLTGYFVTWYCVPAHY